MLDIFIQPELALLQRHVARVVPIGDVDVMIAQQGLHGAAQQGRKVARHRRHQQHARLLLHQLFFEMQQGAKR